MKPANVLILPGWEGSGEKHWQSLWERRHGYRRVEQHDWMHPLRGDWIARLEDVLLGCDEPAVLVAHSLGCILVAAWASVSRNPQRVKGALLVAPADTEREEVGGALRGWSPIPLDTLPFPAALVASHDDPHCGIERARLLATAWGSRFIDHGDSGHINAESGLGSWPEGHLLLQDLIND
ncbi:MAG: RBBP9/YdeN family alpha/beta hydrolase [Ramlibacter sp.]